MSTFDGGTVFQSCAEGEEEEEEGKEKTFEVLSIFSKEKNKHSLVLAISSQMLDVLQEKEMEKQKMLYQQARLHDRGAAEMVLQMVSASKGRKTHKHSSLPCSGLHKL